MSDRLVAEIEELDDEVIEAGVRELRAHDPRFEELEGAVVRIFWAMAKAMKCLHHEQQSQDLSKRVEELERVVLAQVKQTVQLQESVIWLNGWAINKGMSPPLDRE